MTQAVAIVPAPRNVWRIGRRPDPLEVRPPLTGAELATSSTGNRFDSPTGQYSVLYFGSDLETCLAETLARFRPDLEVLEAIRDEWEERLQFMPLGAVPADWRQRRVVARCSLHRSLPFVDLDDPATHQVLRTELAPTLAYFGYTDFDMSTVCSQDRRVTRAISLWAYMAIDDEGVPLYGGIKYMSRIGPRYTCWAAFEDASIDVVELQGLAVENRILQRVARLFDLQVH